jgi:hypothetical protein
MAAQAASGLDAEHTDFREHWSSFGPVTAETKRIEDLSLIGDARGVLNRADDGPVGTKGLKKLGRPSRNNWAGVKAEASKWLTHQSMARHVMRDILGHRKRTLTQDMRDMAVHLGVAG